MFWKIKTKVFNAPVNKYSLMIFKIKLHHRPFNTAYSGIYFGSLDGMPLILILLQSDSSTPPLQTFA